LLMRRNMTREVTLESPRRMCGADAGCLAINYQSLSPAQEPRDTVSPFRGRDAPAQAFPDSTPDVAKVLSEGTPNELREMDPEVRARRERKRERECVLVCVCVRESEKEKEKEREGGGG